MLGGRKVRDWMYKSEALKRAEVSVFDAKRYLSIFSRFIPSNMPLIKGSMVSPRVPELLMHFKMLERNGLSMEQIEQAIAGNIAQDKQVAANSVNKTKNSVIQPEANEMLTLIDVIQQLADNQTNIQNEILQLVQGVEEETKILYMRIEKLERTMTDPK